MTDTTPEAERVLIGIFRGMSVSDKWRQLGELYRTARLLHETGLKLRRPNATARDVVHDWMQLTLEPELLRQLQRDDRWINWLTDCAR